MKELLFSVCIIVGTLTVYAQTNPSVRAVPFTEDFASLTGETDPAPVMPTAFGGGTLGAFAPNLSGRTTQHASDAPIKPSGTNSTTSPGIYDFTGKIGIISSTYNDLTLVLGLNASNVISPKQISVSFDVSTMLNLYDGTTNNFMMGLVFQYRVGETGAFTAIADSEGTYFSNTAPNPDPNRTTGSNTQTLTVTLPAECSAQPAVYVRWIMKRVSGSLGTRPTFAVDNIDVKGIDVLPIKLISFKGKSEVNGVRLNWITSVEQNNDRFEILRSADGRLFSTIGSVKGNGNVTNPSNYSFLDLTATPGVNYYQLRQIDTDGRSEDFKPIAVNSNLNQNILSAYINDAEQVVVTFEADSESDAKILISDVSGKVVFEQSVTANSGLNRLILPGFNISRGINVLSLAINSKIISKKFIK